MTRAILELARSIEPETLAAIPRRPNDPPPNRSTVQRDEVLTLAAADYLSIQRPQWGDLKRMADKHGVKKNSLYTRIYRDGGQTLKSSQWLRNQSSQSSA